jgi:hypothetical protein
VDYTKWVIDCSKALAHRHYRTDAFGDWLFFRFRANRCERKRGVSFHRKVGDYAAKHEVRFARRSPQPL